MAEAAFTRVGSLKDVGSFIAAIERLGINMPCDRELLAGAASPVARPITVGDVTLGNRIAIHPMEGWDGTSDGKPSEATVRRWRRFGASGAKLIWGGEAVAVRHDGRANPNQLLLNEDTKRDLAVLRETLVAAHREACGATDDLFVGLQLTHSGRYSRPNEKTRPEPRILYHHPILDRRVGVDAGYPVLTDGEVRQIIERYHDAARMSHDLGYDFVDIKHCHGYLGHEFLSAHTRGGDYG